MVDQNVRTILDIADRVYVLHAGRVVYAGEADELRENADARLSLGLAAWAPPADCWPAVGLKPDPQEAGRQSG